MALGHAWPWFEPSPAWFRTLVLLGAIYCASLSFRLVAYLALCLRRPTDLRRRYGSWAVVTGPTSGIGRSVAMELARRGLNLVLLDLDAGNLQEASDAIRARHAVKTKAVVFDLSLVGTAQGDEAMRRLRAAVDGLDVGVLMNNAGVARPYAMYLHEADAEAWVRMIRVNLWAVTEVTAAVLPGMVARGRGAVVNMGSASSEAVPSFPLSTMYAATKSKGSLYVNLNSIRYVAQFSRSLYVEYKSKGIDVQCQAPFFVATRMVTGIELLRLLAPFVPTADAYARAAARWIGHGPLCSPTVSHQLLGFITAIVPDVALDWLLLGLSRRQRAAARKRRAARAASASHLVK
ncbi:hypothetical protein EJB05_45156 [Eragrostis curvula]|uniref:Uncharacterized protein n=1 Tax=Eragrostis curvula TaxID=38414 RepID=A0A5J9TJV1_9POAL|nr:hypothetical protein EJB05_45156 [Eragrostis curvula]